MSEPYRKLQPWIALFVAGAGAVMQSILLLLFAIFIILGAIYWQREQ